MAEYGSTGTLLRRYVHGTAVDDPVVWYEGATTSSPRYLHSNHQGSVVAVTDSTGNATALNSYDGAAGVAEQQWGIPSALNQGRFQYTGQAWIPELKMYYYKARIYSPTLGRFLQTDPIGYDDQINLYAYVGNDPVNGTDPTGLRPGDRYRTRDAAGSQAVRDVNDRSVRDGREYGGRVYENRDGTFGYTKPIPGTIAATPTGDIPRGKTDAGDYHTHGVNDEGYDNENFSPQDIKGNEFYGTPGYLGTPSGDIKKFDPNKVDDKKTFLEDERVSVIGNTGDGHSSEPVMPPPPPRMCAPSPAPVGAVIPGC